MYLIFIIEFIILSVITYKMTISERILKVLKDRDMTQVEFAKQVGIATSTISEWKKKKTSLRWKMVASILLIVLLLGENLQFEKTYFISYKELVSGYFQEGSEEAVQKAMEIAAESGREIEIEDAIKYPSVLLYGEIDAAEYLADRTLSDVPPKPESFLGKEIRFTMGIDWEHIDRNKIYIIYHTDAEKFDGFTLLPYRDWYVAY